MSLGQYRVGPLGQVASQSTMHSKASSNVSEDKKVPHVGTIHVDEDRQMRFSLDEIRKKRLKLKHEKEKNREACAEFMNIKTISESFVDNILNLGRKMTERLTTQPNFCRFDKSVSFTSTSSTESSSVESIESKHLLSVRFTGWPQIGGFTDTIGVDKLKEFIETWSYGENWFYDVEFIGGWSDLVNDYYLYESVWSIPTNEYPIAQATASIFFTYEVSRIKPLCCLVDVFYHYEGQATKFIPTKETNPEKNLFNIVNAKLKFFETLRF